MSTKLSAELILNVLDQTLRGKNLWLAANASAYCVWLILKTNLSHVCERNYETKTTIQHRTSQMKYAYCYRLVGPLRINIVPNEIKVEVLCKNCCQFGNKIGSNFCLPNMNRNDTPRWVNSSSAKTVNHFVSKLEQFFAPPNLYDRIVFTGQLADNVWLCVVAGILETYLSYVTELHLKK